MNCPVNRRNSKNDTRNRKVLSWSKWYVPIRRLEDSFSDIQASAQGVNSIESTRDEQDLFFRKGQLAVMNNILNLETQVSAAQEQAETDDVED